MRTFTSILTVVALVVLVTISAGAQYPPTPPTPPPSPPPGRPTVSTAVKAQANVAAQHAKFAAVADTVAGARDHLRHVLMCIEGPNGKNVDASWDNPCKGLGSGILVDLQRTTPNPSLLNMARTADNASVMGLRSNALARMKGAAKEVAALMTRIAQAK